MQECHGAVVARPERHLDDRGRAVRAVLDDPCSERGEQLLDPLGHEPLRPGEQALWLRAPVDGGYRVLGRFEDADADAYGDGHMHLAEVLIILIDHEDDDE